jgi:DNA invertase Pin-like site-specific DNA recombinase
LSPRAYSYIRFSTPEQLKGDSLRRQTEATAEWCQKNDIPLDESLTLRDLGVSAYRGAHRDDKHDLAQFLRAVNQGKVPEGSYLVIENLDRLSREDERKALRLWMDILDAGINIVQLTPETVFRHERSDMVDIIRAIIELSRGHSESRMKSNRISANWEARRKAARARKPQAPRRKDGRVTMAITGLLPAWVEDHGGTLRLIPEKAAVVHRIFRLAAEGKGPGLIVKTLNTEGRPALGPSGMWSRAYVTLILKDRRAMGEYQPRHRDGKPAGAAVVGYYPPAVSEEEWSAARSGAGSKKKPAPMGRVGDHVNIFGGLLRNAREGDAYYMGTRTHKGKYRRVLVSKNMMENGSKVYGFNFDFFEEAVLSLLKEIAPGEVLGDAPGQDEIIALSGQLAYVQSEQEDIAATLMSGKVKALVDALEKKAVALAAQEKELRAKLDEARDKSAHPAGECWGEAMSLIDALAAAPDPKEARLKLRALLRQLAKEIWILVVPRTKTRRMAAVQVFFESGVRRDYLIYSQDAGHCRKGGWWAHSFATSTVAGAGDLDLRNPKHVARLERILAAADLEHETR